MSQLPLFIDEVPFLAGPPTFAQPLRAATISACQTYRYNLTRVWNPERPRVLFCMLNPSTADAFEDDNTVNRCAGYGADWGYGGIQIVNLFGLRATNPANLITHPDPVGSENLAHVRQAAHDAQCERIVCAWGNNAIDFAKGSALNEHWRIVAQVLRSSGKPLHALRVTGEGMPGHPLYLPRNLQLIEWKEPSR